MSSLKVCTRKKIYFKSNLTGRSYCLHGGKIFAWRGGIGGWYHVHSVTEGLKYRSFATRIDKKDWEIVPLKEGVPPCPL